MLSVMIIIPSTRENCYNVSNYQRSWPYRPTPDAYIACGYIIATHNHSWLIINHELTWWTKWHEYFFIRSAINKHQNDQWFQCHSIPLRTVIVEVKVTWYQNSDSLLSSMAVEIITAIRQVQWENAVVLIFLLPRSVIFVNYFRWTELYVGFLFWLFNVIIVENK